MLSSVVFGTCSTVCGVPHQSSGAFCKAKINLTGRRVAPPIVGAHVRNRLVYSSGAIRDPLSTQGSRYGRRCSKTLCLKPGRWGWHIVVRKRDMKRLKIRGRYTWALRKATNKVLTRCTNGLSGTFLTPRTGMRACVSAAHVLSEFSRNKIAHVPHLMRTKEGATQESFIATAADAPLTKQLSS